MDSSAAFWRVLGSLGDSPRKSGSGYEAKCPAHEDQHASLSVGTGMDGRVLLTCHAGCSTENVVAALGLSMGDLFEKSAAGNPVRRFRLLDRAGNTIATHVREDRPDAKEMWWESHGRNGLNGTPLDSLPLYRLPDVLTADPGATIIVTEGEKAADALNEIGILAVGTVTGAAGTPSVETLAPLTGHPVWLWPDNDDAGREHMARIALRLNSEPRWIDWTTAPPKGDAADYVAQGGTAEAIAGFLRPLGSVLTSGPRIWRAPELAAMAFDAPHWAIPDLLPAGLAILAGRPKLGKSWLALGWALDIARCSPALRKLKVVMGETLYLALEDGPRRIQERMALMLGEADPPAGMHIATEWAKVDEGGIDDLGQWLGTHPEARLIVIDTFKRIRAKEKNNQRLYDLDYDALTPMAEMARRHNVAIVVVFHARKGEADDPLELVSGTTGLSGAADAVLVLRRERGQADASLFVTGRDVEEQDLALRWEKDNELGWALLGQAEDFRRSRERQVVIEAIQMMPGMTPAEIADAVEKTRGSVRYLLFRMTQEGILRCRDGKYFPAPNSANSPNGGVSPTPLTALTPPNQSQKAVRGTPTQPLTGVITPNSTPPPPVRGDSSMRTDSNGSAVSETGESGAVCGRCGRPRNSHGPQDLIACDWQPRLPYKGDD